MNSQGKTHETTEKRTHQVLLADVNSFLSKHADDKDRLASLEERTDSATILLQLLPCARYAVLEKLGEVFLDEAQKYVVELERQNLDGLPAFIENVSRKRDMQIRKIQQVLVSSIEANSKAWAPMIFQWAVQTLSQICGQYGTKRHFSSLSLEERFQMWLNCSATNVLLEINITCLNKIVQRNQENCLKCLLNATLSCTPYFDWALAHICSTFMDFIPYTFLCHALEAFSKQSRKAEIIIETMLSIFQLIHKQKSSVIEDVIFKLYEESMVSSLDMKKKESHTMLCTIPFLLHICIQSVDLFIPIMDRFLQSVSHKNLLIIYEQSNKREDVLQRGMLRRIVDCLKMLDASSFKLIQFLIKYACKEDTILVKENPNLAEAVQNFCTVVLELLCLQLKTDVHTYVHRVQYPLKNKSVDEATKNQFLSSLSAYTKQLTLQMLNTTGQKCTFLKTLISLMAIQEGVAKMVEVLITIFLNTDINSNYCLQYFMEIFESRKPDIRKDVFQKIFQTMEVFDDEYSHRQVNALFSNLLTLIESEKSDSIERRLSATYHIKLYVSQIAHVLASTSNRSVAITAMKVLQVLCSSELRISEYAVIAKSSVQYYFTRLNEMSVLSDRTDFDDLSNDLKSCDKLLVKVVSEYKVIQQFVIRLLLEYMLKKDEEEFATDPEEAFIKVELVKSNYSCIQGNRFNNNLTSISFKDGLRLNKRKLEEIHPQNAKLIHSFFISTLSNLLSVSGGFGTCNVMDTKHTNFLTTWGHHTFTRSFPSAYAYTATVIVELVCPEITPVMTWPDEDFLKYTIERDLKVKRRFDAQPVLWHILEVISSARPSLYHCSVILQSLLGMSLKFWQSNRKASSKSSPVELASVSKIMHILKQGGWLPAAYESIADIFHMIKPKEIYEILSAIWKYLKNTNFAADKFLDRDQLGRPQLHVNNELLQHVRTVIKVIFLRNITELGHLYHRFLRDIPS